MLLLVSSGMEELKLQDLDVNVTGIASWRAATTEKHTTLGVSKSGTHMVEKIDMSSTTIHGKKWVGLLDLYREMIWTNLFIGQPLFVCKLILVLGYIGEGHVGVLFVPLVVGIHDQDFMECQFTGFGRSIVTPKWGNCKVQDLL